MYVTIDHPEYLIYLLSIPVLVISHFAFLKYSKRKAIKFANFQALKKVTDQKVVTKNYLLLTLRILILVSLIFAIAGTTVWYKGQTSANDFIIAIDTSASMTASDFSPTRLDAAKQYTTEFLDALHAESSVGVVSFSGAAFIEHLPTKNKAELKNTLNDLSTAHVGGTNIPDAILTSSNLLLPSTKGKTIILLTDGSNTAGYFTGDPIQESINYANSNNVIIYTIGIGTNTGPIGYLPEYYNISSVSDTETLRKLANETGGKFYDAKITGDLHDAYTDILAQSNEAYLGLRLDAGLMIVCLILIFLEWGLISTRFRSFP
jgi:Ca-activated chloride channel family protein